MRSCLHECTYHSLLKSFEVFFGLFSFLCLDAEEQNFTLKKLSKKVHHDIESCYWTARKIYDELRRAVVGSIVACVLRTTRINSVKIFLRLDRIRKMENFELSREINYFKSISNEEFSRTGNHLKYFSLTNIHLVSNTHLISANRLDFSSSSRFSASFSSWSLKKYEHQRQQ